MRARTGQGKPLSVRYAHSPGFSGMIFPPWSVGATENPGARSAEGFFWSARPRAPEHKMQRDFIAPWRQPPHPWSRLRLGWGQVFCAPPPGLRCRVGRFATERHWRSLTPSHAPTLQERIAYRHGRGIQFYNLIPKGGLAASRLPARSVAGRVPLARSDPFANPPRLKPSSTEEAVDKSGGSQRGPQGPLWN